MSALPPKADIGLQEQEPLLTLWGRGEDARRVCVSAARPIRAVALHWRELVCSITHSARPDGLRSSNRTCFQPAAGALVFAVSEGADFIPACGPKSRRSPVSPSLYAPAKLADNAGAVGGT